MSFNPVPKPPPRPKKEPKPIKGRNANRAADNFTRAYGSEERVEFVGQLPCIVPGCPSLHQDNAHIEGDGGSRKAGADKVVPLCRGHHRTRKDSLHNLGREEFEGTHYVDLAALALDTERTWRRYAGHSTTHDGARDR
jgi:hypothetical protein